MEYLLMKNRKPTELRGTITKFTTEGVPVFTLNKKEKNKASPFYFLNCMPQNALEIGDVVEVKGEFFFDRVDGKSRMMIDVAEYRVLRRGKVSNTKEVQSPVKKEAVEVKFLDESEASETQSQFEALDTVLKKTKASKKEKEWYEGPLPIALVIVGIISLAMIS